MFQDSYGKLCGTPQQRVIYDTMRYCYRTVTIIDIGRAFGIQAKASIYDDPAFDRKPKCGRLDESFQKVYAWLRQNGPAFISDIAEELGIPDSTVAGVIKRHPAEFTYTVSLMIARDGGQRTAKLWEVVG